MAYFLFIDESGQDRTSSPYEVLAGMAVEDRDLWNLIQAIQGAEIRHFGTRYSHGRRELKAKKLLNRKTFRKARQLDPFPVEERQVLARACLEQGDAAGRREITALAQAKLAYVEELLEICTRFRCRAFASIVDACGPEPHACDLLRRDYCYLFERFFYYLEDKDEEASGIIVFDELEKSKSHVLVSQMDTYFKRTAKGRLRARQIIPEPFFVHSDLTTGIQLADLIAYVTSWGFRIRELNQPVREELGPYVEAICQLRHRSTREINGNPDFNIWSFAVIKDLGYGENEG
ncbi:DUF3800 domain-containing protein [Geothermobacter hydrogeniphilus]|uniref:DUF3800 domain-containing protein n=1 Tax=Geothermobacter hydrogeniphilus TaxID=1969733 RepID=A0A2K2HC85_9BACT|nr:DUF3800 domain-containing protein [Geothermobacter hydrogeniphilus]PNU20863.1 DUF3800 domain-containing protein [Geothermobacter hydrogeniphilus]